MRATDRSEPPSPESPELEELPSFEIDYYVDDQENPSRVMLMPVSLDLGTSEQWITMDADHAVPLDEVR